MEEYNGHRSRQSRIMPARPPPGANTSRRRNSGSSPSRNGRANFLPSAAWWCSQFSCGKKSLRIKTRRSPACRNWRLASCNTSAPSLMLVDVQRAFSQTHPERKLRCEVVRSPIVRAGSVHPDLDARQNLRSRPEHADPVTVSDNSSVHFPPRFLQLSWSPLGFSAKLVVRRHEFLSDGSEILPPCSRIFASPSG